MKNILFILLLFNHLTTDAQLIKKLDELLQTSYDSIYIENFGQAMLVKGIVAYQDFHYPVTNSNNEKHCFASSHVLYRSAGITYRNVQLQLFFPVKTISSYAGFKNRKSTDINLNLITSSLNGTVYYKAYTGFRVLVPATDTSTYLSEVNLLNIGVHGFYSFNRLYSPNSVFKQTQRQKKSVGSFLIGFDSFFLHNYYPDSETLQYSNIGKLYNLSLMPGYAYTFVPAPKLFINAYAFAGAGIQFPDDFSPTLSSKQVSYIYSLKASTGYNGDNWIICFIYEHKNSILPQDDFLFATNSNFYKFNVAYRFYLD